jgi:hypothetical protein
VAAVPASAVAPDGNLDGVAAGWTWDAAFVNHFRFLCIVNDAATSGRRCTYVDGELFRDEPASVRGTLDSSRLVT